MKFPELAIRCWLAVKWALLASTRSLEDVAYSLALSPSKRAAWKPLSAVAMATMASRIASRISMVSMRRLLG